MDTDSKIYVAGHQGMVGSAVVRALEVAGVANVVTRSRAQLDLCDQAAVRDFYVSERPDVAVIAAARVGGIHANETYPAEFIYQNLAIAQHTIHEAYTAGVRRLLFLGSTCIYPKFASQPIVEEALLSSDLEPTNEAYAVAKIAGLKLCQFYRQQYGVCYHSAMPTNLYGPGDNYHLENSHVLPALIRRFHEAKLLESPEVVIWGSGRPRREFLHADDAAAGILHLLGLENPPDWVNLGSGVDVSIRELAELVCSVVGYAGSIELDRSKPDGTLRKLTDISRMRATGWESSISIEEGVRMAYASFLEEQSAGRLRA